MWHPLAFSEMATHSAKEAVNDTANAAPTANKVPNSTADSVQFVDKTKSKIHDTDNIFSVIETSWSSVYYDFYGEPGHNFPVIWKNLLMVSMKPDKFERINFMKKARGQDLGTGSQHFVDNYIRRFLQWILCNIYLYYW